MDDTVHVLFYLHKKVIQIPVLLCETESTIPCLYSDLPPSQGGKYVGFGSSPAPQSKNDDFFDTTLSSLSSVSKYSIFLSNLLSPE